MSVKVYQYLDTIVGFLVFAIFIGLMILTVESAEVRILLVFNFININVDPGRDRMNYGFEPGALYFAEKP